jgi:hypothetical protein
MNAKVTEHEWSSEALFSKALLYVTEMENHAVEDWQFGFWSSLSLELLARAALARISPTLLANGKDWRNVYHALGHAPTVKGFTPNSVATSEVLRMLHELVPDFTKELYDSCSIHCAHRNAELHSGEERFRGLGTSVWLPKYYASCQIFLRSIGKELNELFADSTTAQEMIAALYDTAAKTVAQEIKIHTDLWKGKTADEQQLGLARTASLATRSAGHRTICPSCGNAALLRGQGRGPVSTYLDEDEYEIVQKQTMLPSSFECFACGLKISGLSKLSACGLGQVFTATWTSSAAEFFNLHTDEELEEAEASSAEPELEEDNNE